MTLDLTITCLVVQSGNTSASICEMNHTIPNQAEFDDLVRDLGLKKGVYQRVAQNY